MASMTATQMVTLKAAVKAEMQRRNGSGSVASYGNASWDFSTVPAAGQPKLADQGHKVIAPILAVKNVSGLADVSAGSPLVASFDYTSLNTVITNLANESRYGDSSCLASCTGLCEGSCTGSCNGCSSCTGDCYGSCYSCQGTCSGTCSGTCQGSCSGCSGCGDGCTSGCVGCAATCFPDCVIVG